MKKDFRNNSIYHEEIDIDVAKGVAIHLSKDEYKNFVSKLVPQLEEQIMQSITRNEKADKKLDECRELVIKIRNYFYDCSSDYALAHEIEDLNLQDLANIINSHNRLLGFE